MGDGDVTRPVTVTFVASCCCGRLPDVVYGPTDVSAQRWFGR